MQPSPGDWGVEHEVGGVGGRGAGKRGLECGPRHRMAGSRYATHTGGELGKAVSWAVLGVARARARTIPAPVITDTAVPAKMRVFHEGILYMGKFCKTV